MANLDIIGTDELAGSDLALLAGISGAAPDSTDTTDAADLAAPDVDVQPGLPAVDVFGNSGMAVETLSVSVGGDLGPAVQGCGCPMCGGNRNGVSEGPVGDGPVGAPTVTASLQTMADYLTTGFWSDFSGTGQRWFNVTNAGPGANNGVLTYDLNGWTGNLNTVYGPFGSSDGISEDRKTMVREAFAVYEAVLGIDFVETTSSDLTDVTADFFFMDEDLGYAYEAEQPVSGSSGPLDYSIINVAANWDGGGVNIGGVNNYTFQTFLHEIGHALGLGHQGNYNAGAGSPTYETSAQWLNDSWTQTMMSYWSQTENTWSGTDSYAQLTSPMAVDWIALNALYASQGFGTSNAFAGNTVFGVGTTITTTVSTAFANLATYAATNAFTIVDGSGIDTVDFSNYSADQVINLQLSSASGVQATKSSVGGLVDNMTIAVGTVIENATGGSGNDTITGNEFDNVLIGNAGNDTINGLGGNDTINGGNGSDTLDGGDGDDTITDTSFDGSANTVNGGAGNDHLINEYVDIGGTWDGGADTDTIDFSFDNFGTYFSLDLSLASFVAYFTTFMNFENVVGSQGDEAIIGSSGANVLDGQGGVNSISGGDGDDTLKGGLGDDTLDGGAGSDTADYSDKTDAVTVALNGATPVNVTSGAETDSIVNIENINGGSAGDTLTGDGNANTLNGNGGNDTIVGGDGIDTINGGDGDDTITGGFQIDILNGGTGNDTFLITTNDFIDDIDGGADTDKVDASTYTFTFFTVDLGAGTYTAGPGSGTRSILNVENFTGTNSGDTITGSSAANTLNGNGGIDTINGGEGTDTLNGGDGNDTLTGGSGADTLNGGDGDDTLIHQSTAGGDFSYGGAGNDTIHAFGLIGAGTVHFGDAGNDHFILAPEDYAGGMDGGADIDTIDASAVTAYGYTFNLAAGTLLDSGSLFNLISFENVTGGQIDDIIIGSSSANVLDGQGGNDNISGGDGTDTITGGDGNDTLNGGAGVDSLTGGLGDDTLVVESAADTVFEAVGQGTDTVITSQTYTLAAGQEIERLQTNNQAAVVGLGLIGNEFANRLTANAGNNTLNGGAGIDQMFGLGGNDTYYVDNAADVVGELVGGGTDQVLASVTYTLAGGQEIETLKTTNDASLGNINLTGNEFNNSMTGNAGNNILTGGLGSDTMRGLGGNDSFVVDNAGDVVIELVGNGTDTVFASVSFALQSGQEIENLQTNNAAAVTAINLTGNNLNNIITGNAGNNTLNGGLGIDTLTGLGGNDLYIVDNAGDVVVELVGGGTDTVSTIVSYTLGSGREIEVLQTGNAGGTDALVLTGNQLAQTIIGNAGNNTLYGKLGLDTLTGGNGQDSFVFDTTLGAANIDTITSFIVADDTILLANSIFTALGVGPLLGGAFNGGAVATQADDRILYDSATKALLYDADGVGGVAAVQFATLSSISGALSAADFTII